MGSAAYLDYGERIREATGLVRAAMRATDSRQASASAKAAAVLAAAALERYMNDVVNEMCSALRVTRWSDLTEGHQRYLAQQMAKALYISARAVRVDKGVTVGKRAALEGAIRACSSAFDSPDTWPHLPTFGVFMKGAASPEKIGRMLRIFDVQQRNFAIFLSQRGKDRAALYIGLTELINARHLAAHAKRGVPPSPKDVRTWIVLSWTLTREIEAFLGYRA